VIVVTGGTGHLGRATIKHLLNKVPAQQIVASVRDTARAKDLAAHGVWVRRCDFDDPASLTQAFAGAERLLIVSTDRLGEGRVAQHRCAVDAARQVGVRHIAYTSITEADSSPLPIAPDHAATEAYIREAGIPFTFLRNNMYIENYTAQLPQVLAEGTLVTSAGEGRVAAAARVDYAEAAAAVLIGEGHENMVYELTGPRAFTFAELAEVASKVSGKTIEHRSVPDEALRAGMRQAGLPDEAAGIFVGLYAAIREGLLARVTGDLEQLIGHSATSLEDVVYASLQA
jgi:NAD(P)H dehydrogenase (quinone)